MAPYGLVTGKPDDHDPKQRDRPVVAIDVKYRQELGLREDVEALSCDPVALYAQGELIDPDFSIDRLADIAARYRGHIDVLAEVFARATVDRAPPTALVGPDPSFLARLGDEFRLVDQHRRQVSPSLLVRIREAIIWNNMLFVVAGGHVLPLYEFYRPNDRGPKGPRIVSRLAACARRETIDLGDVPGLFVGSAGSFNYGHWLVDDYPALACEAHLRRSGKSLKILMSSFDYPASDSVRVEGISLAMGERPTYSITRLDQNIAYHVKNIHYVTPMSYHPFCKNPHAVQYLRNISDQVLFDTPSSVDSDKIFINRASNWFRSLTNANDIVALLASFGVREIIPETMSLREQWATFGASRQIIGIMGAAMASSLFSPPGSHVTYLAPTGWVEPFFWDLAAIAGHRYSAAYGHDDGSDLPLYQRSFSLDPTLLESFLGDLT